MAPDWVLRRELRQSSVILLVSPLWNLFQGGDFFTQISMTTQEKSLDMVAKRLVQSIKKDPNFHSVGISLSLIPHLILYLKGKLELGKYPVTWEDYPVWVVQNYS